MRGFWAGFAVASALWLGGAGYLALGLDYGPPPDEPAVPAADEPAETEAPTEEEAEPSRRRRRRRARTPRRRRTPRGEATVGDDLREDEARTVEMGGGGGEQQLTSSQIDAGIDSAMGRIRRCLVLIEGDEPVTGRLTFGLRIASSGRVEAVRLSGPRAATTGDAGRCLQAAARQMRFDTFDGPTMVVRYPLTLE